VFCTSVKNALGYDDSLDVFGIHGVGGILGAIATGILVNPALGGSGVVDYAANGGAGGIAPYDFATQIWAQIRGVLVTIAWSGIGSAVLYYLVDALVGLRVNQDEEREGLDLADHGERAYNY
jgi:Amt family ammonium transporter